MADLAKIKSFTVLVVLRAHASVRQLLDVVRFSQPRKVASSLVVADILRKKIHGPEINVPGNHVNRRPERTAFAPAFAFIVGCRRACLLCSVALSRDLVKWGFSYITSPSEAEPAR